MRFEAFDSHLKVQELENNQQARSQKPEARSQKPEARSQKPEATKRRIIGQENYFVPGNSSHLRNASFLVRPVVNSENGH